MAGIAPINQVNQVNQFNGIAPVGPLAQGMDQNLTTPQILGRQMEMLRQLFDLQQAGLTDPELMQDLQAMQEMMMMQNFDPTRPAEGAQNLFLPPPTPAYTPTPAAAAPAAAAVPGVAKATAPKKTYKTGNTTKAKYAGGTNRTGKIQKNTVLEKGAGRKGTAQEVDAVVSKMLRGNVSAQQRTQFSESLKDYDIGKLATMANMGVSLRVGSVNEVKSKFGGRNVLGYYNPQDMSITIRQDQINSRVVVHEMAHAEDDARVPGIATYASERDPVLRNLYSRYRNGGNTWSSYAKTDIYEYYAEAVSVLHTNPGELMRKDPQMYAYLTAGA